MEFSGVSHARRWCLCFWKLEGSEITEQHGCETFQSSPNFKRIPTFHLRWHCTWTSTAKDCLLQTFLQCLGVAVGWMNLTDIGMQRCFHSSLRFAALVPLVSFVPAVLRASFEELLVKTFDTGLLCGADRAEHPKNCGGLVEEPVRELLRVVLGNDWKAPKQTEGFWQHGLCKSPDLPAEVNFASAVPRHWMQCGWEDLKTTLGTGCLVANSWISRPLLEDLAKNAFETGGAQKANLWGHRSTWILI